MRRLGAIFSALCLAALLWGLWLLWAPQPVPPRPQPTAEGWHWPDLRLPRLAWPPILQRPPARPEAPIASPVERILVEKSARRMTVWQREGAPRRFRIALGFSPDGDKGRQGDGRTPEGIFRIDRLNRQSAYHLSLGLDYPQKRHRDAARRGGYDPGGDIMIHGQPNQVPDGYRVKGDWTAGCIALTNAEIEEIFAHAALGTEVEIRP
ncbi:L,D-transpeptidase catalytic domain [Paracoccus aminovorans]|uniref:L,D-transpeptidase catalytic domain n=1 Tax=Paracoccus aminovorans TaxID=34004 RepID=A0A1I2ZLQ0_9RHOB|nr:L,D-transpeptidase family protein [Paracoccus aminovorans]CQR85112.1 ErfK/YbiS/YcfS/YnhG family protein [Paracoccus aminovorans]SFH38575.1 L,D-transpeptidase catalytic domain [Paracoccus aminovorans]